MIGRMSVIAGLALWLASAISADRVAQAQDLIRHGDYRGALTILAPVLEADPKNVEAHFTAAAALSRPHRDDECISASSDASAP